MVQVIYHGKIWESYKNFHKFSSMITLRFLNVCKCIVKGKCLDFIQQFRINNIHEDFWRNAKVLRCIMRLFAINKNKMKIDRLIKQIKNNHNYIDSKQEDTEIQQDIKAIYEKGYKRISLVA